MKEVAAEVEVGLVYPRSIYYLVGSLGRPRDPSFVTQPHP